MKTVCQVNQCTGCMACVELCVSASKEGVVLFPPPIDILGKTNIF